MKTKIYFIIFLLICFGIGLTARYALTPTETRAQAFMRLFETHCLPLAHGGDFAAPDGSIVFGSLPGEDIWTDQKSRLQISYDNRSGNQICAVDDRTENLSESGRLEIETIIAAWVSAKLPQLTSMDENPLKWPSFLGWFEYPPGDPRRWGILLSRAAGSGDLSQLTLTLYVAAQK